MVIDSKKAQELTSIVARIIGSTEETVTNTMLDMSKDFLAQFLGAENESEISRFEAIPQYWAWFRMLWAGSDFRFVMFMDSKPWLIGKLKNDGINLLEVYAEHHWSDLKGKRPVSSAMALFLETPPPAAPCLPDSRAPLVKGRNNTDEVKKER